MRCTENEDNTWRTRVYGYALFSLYSDLPHAQNFLPIFLYMVVYKRLEERYKDFCRFSKTLLSDFPMLPSVLRL